MTAFLSTVCTVMDRLLQPVVLPHKLRHSFATDIVKAWRTPSATR